MIDADSTRAFLEAAVLALSLLGGTMAYLSGFWAAQALVNGEHASVVGDRVNEGIGIGFIWGAPIAVVAFTIVV